MRYRLGGHLRPSSIMSTSRVAQGGVWVRAQGVGVLDIQQNYDNTFGISPALGGDDGVYGHCINA